MIEKKLNLNALWRKRNAHGIIALLFLISVLTNTRRTNVETVRGQAAKHMHHSPALAPSDFHLFSRTVEEVPGTELISFRKPSLWAPQPGPDFFYAGFDRLALSMAQNGIISTFSLRGLVTLLFESPM
ncbi:hypothetical protein AVEN_221417-1 [Araneus ventricosus]|uniref:Uncharacterized protein n=1 Tax=Araneus ventricosus TaxID=182803 RepID=A0A4Y2PN92_ARAVE|nr:hypothetical protein AVEN_221417-1 [Araneus ventricosus]